MTEQLEKPIRRIEHPWPNRASHRFSLVEGDELDSTGRSPRQRMARHRLEHEDTDQ